MNNIDDDMVYQEIRADPISSAAARRVLEVGGAPTRRGAARSL